MTTTRIRKNLHRTLTRKDRRRRLIRIRMTRKSKGAKPIGKIFLRRGRTTESKPVFATMWKSKLGSAFYLYALVCVDSHTHIHFVLFWFTGRDVPAST